MGWAKPQVCTPDRLHTTTITDLTKLAGIREAWRALWHKCSKTTPFQSPDWLEPWWDIFAPGQLRMIAVYDSEALIGLAPLYRDGTRLLPVGISLSDYQDIVLDPDHVASASEALGAAIAGMDGVDICEFDELAPDGLALQIAYPGIEEQLSVASPCPRLQLPRDLAELAQCISPSRIRKLRNARRKAARRGDTAIIEGDIDNAVALFRELVRLHGLRWQAEKQSGVFADPRVQTFHIAALPGLIEQDIARLYALAIGDAVVGVYYGFRHHKKAYAYAGGYDPEYSFASPGSVLLGHAIEQAIREGAETFDFLRGDEDYKYEWGGRDRWNVRLTLRRCGNNASS